MKIYSRRKFIVGWGMLVLAVIFIFTTVLSGRINMLILLSGAVFVVIGINAVHSATVTDAWKCEDRDSEGSVKPVSRDAREIEAKAAKAVLFAVQLLCLLAASIAAIVYTLFEMYSGECRGIMILGGAIPALSFLAEWSLEAALKKRKNEKEK
ncbi:MAG TPA: hypothetical protein IAB13_05525 [Candidatus Avanaerovorax faecigallinarum]|nr:hypothetical protein [Candidatus Avanaerovorax faecigallinarum]